MKKKVKIQSGQIQDYSFNELCLYYFPICQQAILHLNIDKRVNILSMISFQGLHKFILQHHNFSYQCFIM